MRVAILGPLPAGGVVGGVATHTGELARALTRAGVPVRVFDDAHPHGAAPEGADGVRGASAGTRLRLALADLRHGLGGLQELSRLGIPRTTSRARTLLLADAARAFSPEVIHIQQADFRPLYADAAGLDRPRVITVHGLGALETKEYPGLAQVIPANLANADAVTTPSHALAEEVTALGVPADRVTVIPNGVDHTRFYPRDRGQARLRLGVDHDSPLVVFAGRITVHKGAVDLAKAWPDVRRAHPHALLAFVGPSGDADVNGVEGALLPGTATPADLAWWYAAADVVVVPSRYEGFGLVALEAMACGRPVVATAVGGLPEVVPPKAGALVPPRDPAALADAIAALLGDPQTRSVAEDASQEAAARYTWDATASSFIHIYRELQRC
ncbi:MAG: glycosyltransferase family 4 protein [Actinomycetia bacterium]|nr:glycosyltransferase family 4 protein [Actinomycetes bacterium]